jgi:hypothetical protein
MKHSHRLTDRAIWPQTFQEWILLAFECFLPIGILLLFSGFIVGDLTQLELGMCLLFGTWLYRRYRRTQLSDDKKL